MITMRGLGRVLTLCCVCAMGGAFASDEIDLSGCWTFQLDPGNRGITHEWFGKPLTDAVTLPGSIQAQGFGDAPGPQTSWVGDIQKEWDNPKYAPYRTADNFKMPFWLQPDRCYSGAAWFRKNVVIPAEWAGRHVTLTLERPHWKTTVWVNDREMGSQLYLSAPHVYDVGAALRVGENTITVRVENGMVMNVGPNSHSVSDHTQSNWNGIVGDIILTARPAVWLEDIQVYPDVKSRRIRCEIQIGNQTNRPGDGVINASVATVDSADKPMPPREFPVKWTEQGGHASFLFELGEDALTWDEFAPNLYRLDVALNSGKTGKDTQSTRFGLREVSTRGTQITINDRPVFLRGTLECCIFPMTGHPPTDVEAWERIIRVCKAHGLNHIRFHSWCPPDAAFEAADRLGFYFQVECSTWSNQGATLGDGAPLDDWSYREADRILTAYGNHPSFLLLAQGNEPAGAKHAEFLAQWVNHFKTKDPRRLVTAASAWPIIDENDYHVWHKPRIHQWGQGLNSRINAQSPATTVDYRDFVAEYPDQPVISHEIGQWCVYPNFDEIPKYTGILKPKNFEVFRDFLDQKHMLDQARDFLMASGKLQTLCYKEEIESALRTPGFGGFQLLDLHDFPGQGTALVGVLDPFWDSKPYVSPAEFSRFCAPTVPLARLPKRVFTTDETIKAQVDIAHYGPNDIGNARVSWTLTTDAGDIVAEGDIESASIPAGDLTAVGSLAAPLSKVAAPAKLVLDIEVDGTPADNSWDVWVYPEKSGAEKPRDVVITDRLDKRASRALRDGGNVLLLAPPDAVKTDVALGFSSIFWNTAWTQEQPPHTLGILCNPAHPALALFPTEYHGNWQWYEIVSRAATIEMDALPPALRPIIQVVPDWFTPKRLGLLFEARVEGGKLLVCSADLTSDIEARPVARQLRHSLVEYMRSDAFDPKHDLDIEDVRGLFAENRTD